MGLVDTAIAGHLKGDAQLAAIGLGSNVFNMLYWLFGFLRMGTVGLTAQAYGAGDARAQSTALWRGWMVGLAIGVLIVLFHRPFISRALLFMSPDAEVVPYAREYLSIVMWGAPAVMITYVVSGWLPGMQSSRKPMTIAIFVNVLNIVVSPLLAFGLDMGLRGVATGTLVAQWAGAILGVVMCLRYRLPFPGIRAVMALKELKAYFSLNVDIFLRTLCLIGVTAWFTRAGARLGTEVLAANSVMMQLFLFFSYFTDGFAYAAEALVGKYLGARDGFGLRDCVRHLLGWSTAIAVVFTVIYAVGGNWIVSLLSDSEAVRATARDYIYWIVTVPLCGYLAFTWDGIFTGAMATRRMLVAMAAATAIFFGTFWLLRSSWGNHALWLAFILYLLTRGVGQWLLWPSIMKRFKNML